MTYIKSLDGIRALAVISVMAQHFLPPELYNGVPLGEYGVVAFFVLSGFLITRILLESREAGTPFSVSIRVFYVRRVLRIFPLYYLTIAVASAIGLGYVSVYAWWHLLYATNILIAVQGDWLWYATHLWSLSVEEQFYLIWPFVVLLAPRRSLPYLIAFMIVLAPTSRIVGAHLGFSFPANYVLPHQRLDALGLGALVAYLTCYRPHGLLGRESVCAAVMVVGIAGFAAATMMLGGRWPFHCMVFQASFVALFAAGLVSYCVCKDGSKILRPLELSPIVYIGKISYGIYIIHNFMPVILHDVLKNAGVQADGWRLIGLEVFCTLAISTLSWHLFENPITKLKKFFPYDRSAPASSHAADGETMGRYTTQAASVAGEQAVPVTGR